MWITDLTLKIENLAAKAEIFYKLAATYYRDVIQKEIALANINKDDHILCIGGGMCPFSAILFHQITGAKVTVIDNNKQCIPKARGIIERMGLSSKINAVYCDGCAACDEKYTVVHFALQVNPMERVFSHIEKNAAPGTKLLLRRPRKRLLDLYSKLPKLSSCPFTVHSGARNIGSTLMYIKN